MRLFNRRLNMLWGLTPSAFNQELEIPLRIPNRKDLTGQNYRFTQSLLRQGSVQPSTRFSVFNTKVVVLAVLRNVWKLKKYSGPLASIVSIEYYLAQKDFSFCASKDQRNKLTLKFSSLLLPSLCSSARARL